MDDLIEILRKVRAFGGKILFKQGDVCFWEEEGEGVLYVDTRSTFDLRQDIHLVRPIAYEDGDYYYICPNCMKIHRTQKMEQYRFSFTPDCFGKSYGKGRKSSIRVIIDGKMLKLQIPKMRLLYKKKTE